MSDFLELLVAERDRGDAVHLHPGESPAYKGKLAQFHLDGPRLGWKDTEELLAEVASADQLRQFKLEGRVTFDLQLRNVAVFQIAAFREQDGVRIEIRPARWL